MFETLRTGWSLAKTTRQLVFRDKDLFLYPIAMIFVVIAEAILIAIPILFFYLHNPNSTFSYFLSIILSFLFYLAGTFTATYILMAMFVAFRSFLKGKKLKLMDALEQVRPYWKLILEWSVFYSIVIMVLRALESRSKSLAGALIGLVGSMALSLITVL